MEKVEPIRSEKKIKDLKQYLLGLKNIRNYALIGLGLNTALRISDMLSLTWEDVYEFEESSFKTHVYIKEQKTGKYKKIFLNKNAVEDLLKHKKQLGHVKPFAFLSPKLIFHFSF